MAYPLGDNALVDAALLVGICRLAGCRTSIRWYVLLYRHQGERFRGPAGNGNNSENTLLFDSRDSKHTKRLFRYCIHSCVILASHSMTVTKQAFFILFPCAALCTAIIMPMSRRWADRLDNEQKKYLTNLLSWRILLWFHWNILLPTFCRRAIVTEAGLAVTHAASIVYRNVVIIWLFLLVAYINKTPRYYPSQEEQATPGNNVEMTKLTCTAPVYPKQSELVTTVNCISPSPQLGELVMPMLRGMKLSPI